MKALIFLLLISLNGTSSKAEISKTAKSKDTTTLALKNYRELFGALAIATKLDPTTPEIANYYQQVIGQLPRNGTLVEFNSQSLIGSVGLASAFCKRVIYQDAELNVPKSGLNQGIDFTKSPALVTDEKLALLIKNYSTAFLQRSPTASEQKTLSALFKSQGLADPTSLGTRTAVLAVCTGIAGSFEFLAN